VEWLVLAKRHLRHLHPNEVGREGQWSAGFGGCRETQFLQMFLKNSSRREVYFVKRHVKSAGLTDKMAIFPFVCVGQKWWRIFDSNLFKPGFGFPTATSAGVCGCQVRFPEVGLKPGAGRRCRMLISGVVADAVAGAIGPPRQSQVRSDLRTSRRVARPSGLSQGLRDNPRSDRTAGCRGG